MKQAKRSTPTEISAILPQALQTLVRPTPPSPTSIDRAAKWLTKSDWGLTGNETLDERNTLIEAYQEGVRFLASILDGLEPYWLILVGTSGTGKTMLTHRIANFMQHFGDDVYADTVARKLGKSASIESVSYSYNQEGSCWIEWSKTVPHEPDNQVRYNRAKRDWFKAIDDLKAQTGEMVTINGELGIQPKAFEVRAAGDLLDARLKRWTIINSNLTRSQLAVFWDTRIASRLMRHGNTMVDLSNVRDFAFRKKSLPKT